MYTISMVIEELEKLKNIYGDIEVKIPQIDEREKLEWDACISWFAISEEHDTKENVVKIY